APGEGVVEEAASGVPLDAQLAEAPGQRVAEEADAIDAAVAGHRLVEEGHARRLAGGAAGRTDRRERQDLHPAPEQLQLGLLLLTVPEGADRFFAGRAGVQLV